MRLIGKIYEMYSHAHFRGSRAFLTDGNRFSGLVKGELKVLFRAPYKDGFAAVIMLNGLWICRSNQPSKFIDIFNTKKIFPDIEFMLCENFCHIGDLLLLDDFLEDKLVRLNTESWENVSRSFEKGIELACDEYTIYVRSDNEKLVECYDHDLNKQWEYTLEGQVYIDFERKPQLHNDLVIINHAFHIIALNKRSGQEVWKYTFEDIPSSNVLMEGKIYAVCKAILYVINPDTGQVELEQDTGLPAKYGQDNYNRNEISIIPYQGYLYGVSQWPVDMDEKAYNIFLFNSDASEILDKQYTGAYYLCPSHSIRPVVRNGKIYQLVRNGYSFSTFGMLVLELAADEDATIKVQPRPPATMLATPSLCEPHKLQIYLDADHLDDALRYGELLVEELFYATGYITIYELRESALDKNHTGEIELIIDDTDFETGAKDYLADLECKLAEGFDSNLKRAGDKKTKIHFKLTTQAKSEWKLSGERLDWPAIREQETPLV